MAVLDCIDEPIDASLLIARAAGDQALGIIDPSAAVFVRTAVNDVDGVRAALSELNTIAGVARQPSLIGYTHFAAGGVAGIADTDRAVAELRTAME